MTTTHKLAWKLLALPDVPVVIELWMNREGFDPEPVMTEYDPTGTAIIIQSDTPSPQLEPTVFKFSQSPQANPRS